MKTNLKFQDTNSLPEELPLVAEKLDALKVRVADLQKGLPRDASSRPTLESAQRDALKAKLELEGLEAEYDDIIGLDMVELRMHGQLIEVGEARNKVAALYVECDDLLDIIKPALKAMRGKVAAPVLESLETLNDEIRAVLKSIQTLGREIPELGMTFAEWNSLSLQQRSAQREPGRPTAPLEAKILKTRRRLQDCVATANRLSGGEMRSIDEVTKNVELSKRGRPKTSELGKTDRKLANLVKRLDEVSGERSATREKKIARLTAQIEELREEIRDGEAELNDVDAAKRELEILRGKHRDMVVEEVQATGENQSALLLAILRNEDAQMTAVNKIRQLDPEATVTVTHKVNPKDTRQRFERLRLNGQMKDAELEELTRLEHRQFTFAYSRNR